MACACGSASEGESRVGVALISGVHGGLELGSGHQPISTRAIRIQRIVVEEAVAAETVRIVKSFKDSGDVPNAVN